MSAGSLEHRAAKVSLVTGLSTVLSIAFQFISVSVCLKYWGQETYGSWLALFATFLILRSFDAGYVGYVGNKLNYLYHQDLSRLRLHLSSAVTGIVLIGGVQLAIVLAWLASGKTGAMNVDEPDSLLNGLGLLVLVTSWILSGSYIGIVQRLLIPAGFMYQAAWWSMAFQASNFIAIMAAAFWRLNMLQTSVLFAIVQMSIYLAAANNIRRKLPAFFPWWQHRSLAVGLGDLRKSMLLTVSNLLKQGSTSGIVLLVAAVAGPVAVPIFTTIRTLANLWTNVTNVLTTPLLPDVVRFHAKGEGEKLAATLEPHWVVVGSIVNWGVLFTYPLLAPLYSYWTSGAIQMNTSLMCLLLSSVVVTNAGALMALYLNGINSLRIILGASIVRFIFGLVGGAIAYSHIGLAGFGLGILAGEVATLVLIGVFFLKHELVSKGVQMPAVTFVPATIGTSSVLFFLASQGFGWLPLSSAWVIAISGVAIASIWGWKRLDHDMRSRLSSLTPISFKSRK